MFRLYIVPYKLGSESARSLAQSLDVKRINLDKSLRLKNVIVNWGRDNIVLNSSTTRRVINNGHAVAVAKNKLRTLQKLSEAGVSVPDFTTNSSIARDWLSDDNIVYARQTLTGQSGQGIRILTADSTETIPQAPLYTKGIVKAHEYRVHIAFGNIIDFSKKRRRNEQEANPYIKNLDNGWVFCRDDVRLPNQVMLQSIAAVNALGLDFGAVDVVYKERDNKAYILEVNTAPGLEGTTLERYKTAITNYVESNYGSYVKASTCKQTQGSQNSRQLFRYRV